MTDDDKTNVFVPQANAVSPDALVGTILAGKYQIERLLGKGAMGAVYLGRHLTLGRQDAIKVLLAGVARDRDAMARFDRGVRNVSTIGHPNVCTIYDFGQTADGLQYVAMELIVGESLAELIDRDGPIPTSRAIRIAGQIAAALNAAHNAGVVHRDLKPANVMLARGADGRDVVKVVDFDISKGREPEANAEVTRLGGTVGTPAYMSPEQARGRALDGRSDLYSLALVVYRMLTGALPFRGETDEEIRWARTTDAPLTLNQIAPAGRFPSPLQTVLDGALERDPIKRIASASQFAEQLRAAIGEPSLGGSDSALEHTRASASPDVITRSPQEAATRPGRRTRIAVVASTVVVVTLGAIYAGRTTLFGEPTAAPLILPVDASAANDSLRQRAPKAESTASSRTVLVDTTAVPAVTRPTPTSTPTPTSASASKPPSKATTTPTSTPKTTPTSSPTAIKKSPERELSPPPLTPPSGVQLQGANIKAIIDGQRDRLLEQPDPAPSVLHAMRDTLRVIYDMSGVSEPDRTRSANLVASLSYLLRDRATCITWATRATERAPNNEGYASRLNICRNLNP